MEGHHQTHHHFAASFHHHHEMAAAAAAAAAASRMNSTPISDEDELDMDDSVSLSSNADGSCTSPRLSSANQLADNCNQINGNFQTLSNTIRRFQHRLAIDSFHGFIC